MNGIVKFWAYRIGFDLSRIDEVPNKLKTPVSEYIAQSMAD
jgi:hypothetical protein|nr:MAG TPA: hypothetical protein [Caudoviricetes sp.]